VIEQERDIELNGAMQNISFFINVSEIKEQYRNIELLNGQTLANELCHRSTTTQKMCLFFKNQNRGFVLKKSENRTESQISRPSHH